jgi:hypothetical protein
MSRRRLTWNGRMASAPPAMPGYQEPSIHPAAYPDPEADAYENGDTSSWAEDPHPGPYPNTMHPALPGTDAPQGHPATDPAHYFPAGVAKQASRQLRAAMEAKAAKCIRISTAMLGRKASVSAIEDQALDLMNLTDRQISAALKRIAEDGMAQDVPTEASADLLAFENYTLTEARQADEAEALLAEMMAEESHMAGSKMSEQMAGKLSEILADQVSSGKMSDEQAEELVSALMGSKMSEEAKAEALLAEMMAEESHMAGKLASRKRAYVPGTNQNQPEHYYFQREGLLASEEKADDEAEELLAEMEAEEAKEPKAAKKADLMSDLMSEEAEEDPMADLMSDEADEVDADELAALYGMKLAGKKSEEADEAEADEAEADEADEVEADEEPKAAKKAAVRPQARKASTGVRTLGAVSKVASSGDVNDLSKLWESAPDVSKIFG